jgi:hypothetical protein
MPTTTRIGRPVKQARPDLPAPPTSTQDSCPMPAGTPAPLVRQAGRDAFRDDAKEKGAR